MYTTPKHSHYSDNSAFNISSPEIEDALLSELIWNPSSYKVIQEIIVDFEFFSIPQNQEIYKAIAYLVERGQTANLQTICEFLTRQSLLEAAGGMNKLIALSNPRSQFFPIDAREYALILKEKYERRSLIAKANDLIKLASDPFCSIEDLQTSLIRDLQSLGLKSWKDKLSLELQLYLSEENPLDQWLHKKRIQSHYGIDRNSFDFLIKAEDAKLSADKKSIYSFEELFNRERQPKEWLVPGLLPKGEMVILAGKAKAGKSRLACDLLHSLLSGESFLGEPCTKIERSILYSCDEDSSITEDRLYSRGVDLLPGRTKNFLIDQFDLNNIRRIEAEFIEFQPQLIIVDCLAAVSQRLGVKMAEPEFAQFVHRLAKLCQKHGTACILIHHFNKDPLQKSADKMMGSALLAAVPWGMWMLEEWDDKDDRNPYRIFKSKCRGAASSWHKLSSNYECEWLEKGCFKWEGNMEDMLGIYKEIEEKIISLFQEEGKEGLTASQIKEKLNNQTNNIYLCLDKLKERNLIYKRRSFYDQRIWIYYPSEELIKRKTSDKDITIISFSQKEGGGVKNDPKTPPPTLNTKKENNEIRKVDEISFKEEGHNSSLIIDSENLLERKYITHTTILEGERGRNTIEKSLCVGEKEKSPKNNHTNVTKSISNSINQSNGNDCKAIEPEKNHDVIRKHQNSTEKSKSFSNNPNGFKSASLKEGDYVENTKHGRTGQILKIFPAKKKAQVILSNGEMIKEDLNRLRLIKG
jgi:predicted transcriptional regulator